MKIENTLKKLDKSYFDFLQVAEKLVLTKREHTPGSGDLASGKASGGGALENRNVVVGTVRISSREAVTWRLGRPPAAVL